ncbi:MAG TPA: hemerythrin domain-containing protein [Sphingomicrobium sp.]
MATRSANRSGSSRSRSSSSTRSNASKNDRSAFRWGTGAIAGAALGGAALAIAANLGRKFLTQSFSASQGNWADSLAAEHDMVLAMFDKMLATDPSQTVQRKMLLMKLNHALDKHAYAEEHVVYPALREANDRADAEGLETEHGEVKEFLYRLQHMELDAPNWLETIREFRAAVEAHAKMEEEQVFPRLRSEIDDALDERITKEVNKAGFMMA